MLPQNPPIITTFGGCAGSEKPSSRHRPPRYEVRNAHPHSRYVVLARVTGSSSEWGTPVMCAAGCCGMIAFGSAAASSMSFESGRRARIASPEICSALFGRPVNRGDGMPRYARSPPHRCALNATCPPRMSLVSKRSFCCRCTRPRSKGRITSRKSKTC